VGTVALMVAGAAFTLLAALSLWSWRTFANSDGFADVTTDMLADPAVAEVVADQIVTVLENQDSVARASATARPLLREIVKDVVQTEAFRGLFHAGARELHASVMAGYRTRMEVEVDDAASLVKEALVVVNPGLANSIPDRSLAVLVGVSQNHRIDVAMRVADLAGWFILPMAGAAIICFALSVQQAADRRLALEFVGVSVLVVGVVIFAVLGALLVVAADIGEDPLHRTALRAVFWSLVHVLNVTAKLLMIVGASLGLAAALAGTDSFEARMRGIANAGRIVLARPITKAIAALTAVAIGLLGLIWPLATGQLLVRIAAVALFTVGLVWVFDLVGAASWVVNHSGEPHRTGQRLAAVGAIALVAVASVLALGGMAFVRAVRPTALERADIHDTGCNGWQALCSRPIDQVVFAGTHNSMAASSAAYFGAHQSGGIGAQLAFGIRAFLIDLHYGTRYKDLARTEVLAEAQVGGAFADIGPKEQAALDNAFKPVFPPSGTKRSVFLCHVYCELGATDARAAFAEIRDFLRVNRNEVVVLDLEDHVSAADAVRVIEKSGLSKRAFVWTRGRPAPTLQQLIDSKKNVVIVAENHGGELRDAPWYMSAYGQVLQDTPFDFGSEAQLSDPSSCALLRGASSAPLFLVNQWVDTGRPDPVGAGHVNGTLLRGRVLRCGRRHVPNIIAVDFYERGQLMELVNAMNGVGNVVETTAS